MLFKKVFSAKTDTTVWANRAAKITDERGKVIFQLPNVLAPESWSDNAVNIVASKYFKKFDGVLETRIDKLIERVVTTVGHWGQKFGYFSDIESKDNFKAELTWLLTHQYFSFNSPVWFNLGVPNRTQQCAACFLIGVEDTMESIYDWIGVESRVFRGGSGAGTNISALREKNAPLSSGGASSGPLSFMKAADYSAGAIKSGGGTRRAAKLVCMNHDHPDIEEFIQCKQVEEKKAQALIAAGFDGSLNGDVYSTVAFQNMNHSVRVSDDYMRRVVAGETEAVNLMNLIAQCAHASGDPGLQYDDTINRYHTLPESGRNNTTNPCQPASATVLTPLGIRTFADIEIGSTIWSGKRWTRVVRKVCTGKKPVHKYLTNAGAFVGTEEHRVFSDGIRVEAYQAEHIDTAQGEPEKGSDELNPYTVMDGLLIGDGSACTHGGKVTYITLCVGVNDQCYFESELKNLIDHKFYATDYIVRTTLVQSELPKTYDRVVPDRFFHGSTLTMRSFLRGLYTANGSVVDGRIQLKASSFTLIEQVQQMLSALGIPSYYGRSKGKEVKFKNGSYQCKDSYNLCITAGRAQFLELIGFIHPYKQDRLVAACSMTSRNWSKNSYEITSTEELGVEDVYDITVDDEQHSYWTGGLLVSNCSEFMSTDWSSCLLASTNLVKFYKPGVGFDFPAFQQVVDLITVALDIMIDGADYPDERFRTTAHNQRQLGIGNSNLGALLMIEGLPYNDAKGRLQAASIASVMTAESYIQSSKLAAELGPFKDFILNRESMLKVVALHLAHAIQTFGANSFEAALWAKALEGGENDGYRNATATLEAPTGTISFMMDCDTTGIEPDVALTKYKTLSGGGELTIVNQSVQLALENLFYSGAQITSILKHLARGESMESAPHLKADDLPVFDCALPPRGGQRSIDPHDHLLMVAAIQPFLSMGISKTINMPSTATVDEVFSLYVEAWKQGIKSISIYRDGCKASQPLNVTKIVEKMVEIPELPLQRHRLPDERHSFTHKFNIAGFEGYLTVGCYADGSPGEVFINASKQGSTVGGLLDAVAILTSMALQYGVPLEMIATKMTNTRFEPAGFTQNPAIPQATSVVDYVYRWMEHKFSAVPAVFPAIEVVRNTWTNVSGGFQSEFMEVGSIPNGTAISIAAQPLMKAMVFAGQTCSNCGSLMVRSGTCNSCPSCGNSSGGCG